MVSYALQSAVDQETHDRAAEFAASRGQGADQPARADASVVRVGGGTDISAAGKRLPARRCRRRRPSTSPWSSHSDAPGSSSAACEISSTTGMRTPSPARTCRTAFRRTAEPPGSASAGDRARSPRRRRDRPSQLTGSPVRGSLEPVKDGEGGGSSCEGRGFPALKPVSRRCAPERATRSGNTRYCCYC